MLRVGVKVRCSEDAKVARNVTPRGEQSAHSLFPKKGEPDGFAQLASLEKLSQLDTASKFAHLKPRFEHGLISKIDRTALAERLVGSRHNAHGIHRVIQMRSEIKVFTNGFLKIDLLAFAQPVVARISFRGHHFVRP